MNNEFLTPITCEADLELYAEYLEKEFQPAKQIKELLRYLEHHVGKHIKVDLFSNARPESRAGILKQTGNDFLILKNQQQTEYIIPLSAIKSITVLQNNKKLPHF